MDGKAFASLSGTGTGTIRSIVARALDIEQSVEKISGYEVVLADGDGASVRCGSGSCLGRLDAPMAFFESHVVAFGESHVGGRPKFAFLVRIRISGWDLRFCHMTFGGGRILCGY